MNPTSKSSATDVLARNNVAVSGTATQAMVFVHGFGCDQHMWRLVAPAFEAAYRVVLLDLVGAGNSDLTAYDPARYSTLDAHAEDVLRGAARAGAARGGVRGPFGECHDWGAGRGPGAGRFPGWCWWALAALPQRCAATSGL